MIKTPLIWLVRLYKLVLSPVLPPSCRFYPSCSEYAAEALKAHGAAKGAVLAAKRVFKCHPFHPGGVDHVPSPELGQKKRLTN